MSFFDHFNASVTNATRTVSQKVKNLNDTNKLTSQIKTEQNNIQQNLIAIGQKYYEICRNNPDEDFRSMVEAITKSEQAIAQLQQEIENVRAREPELMSVPEQSVSTFTAPKPAAMVCMNCGNTYENGTAFCSVCGQKLVSQYENLYQAKNAPVETERDAAAQIDPETVTEEKPEPEFIEAQITEPDTEATPAFCPYCGHHLSVPDAPFCSECGKAL